MALRCEDNYSGELSLPSSSYEQANRRIENRSRRWAAEHLANDPVRDGLFEDLIDMY